MQLERPKYTYISITKSIEKRNWKLIPTFGSRPTPRDCHSAILYKNKMVIFAGGDGFSWLNDMFEFNLDASEWKEIQTKGFPPSKRAGHSAVQYKNSMIIFGGWNGNNTLNDCHEFDFRNFFYEFYKKLQMNGNRCGVLETFLNLEILTLPLFTKIK
jgi:hypothetical protein